MDDDMVAVFLSFSLSSVCACARDWPVGGLGNDFFNQEERESVIHTDYYINMVADQRIVLEGGKLIFTYGTLKQGFSNHGLLQDMIDAGDASFLGVYRTVDKLPLVCGPYKVPFLLNMPGSGDRVYGELYAISQAAIPRMDELEGTNRGHYERLPIKVIAEGEGGGGCSMRVEAYYAHRSYAAAMWKRSGEKGLSVYSTKETKGYVRRKDRPAHLTFLDHINLFISSSSPPLSSA